MRSDKSLGEFLSGFVPRTKREVKDPIQKGLYLVAGPRTLKWIVRYRAPTSGENVKLDLGRYGGNDGQLDLDGARRAAGLALNAVRLGDDPRHSMPRRRSNQIHERAILRAVKELGLIKEGDL